MSPQNEKSAAAKALSTGGEILVLSHVNPDGDAVGSVLGLTLALVQNGFRATGSLAGGVPAHYRWLPSAEILKDHIPKADYKAIVLLDCGEFSRSGFEVGEWKNAVKVNIDHHTANPHFGDVNFVVEGASATGELVLELLEEMGIAPSPESATALYAAIHTDTGGFRYSNSTASAFAASARLVGLGAEPAFVAQNLYERESPARTALLGKVLGTIQYRHGGKTAVINVTQKMLEATGTTLEDTENFVNFPRSVEGVETAIFLKEKSENLYRVTLRSANSVDVAQIARKFGGGGHKRAAGATLEGTLEDSLEKLLAEIALQPGS